MNFTIDIMQCIIQNIPTVHIIFPISPDSVRSTLPAIRGSSHTIHEFVTVSYIFKYNKHTLDFLHTKRFLTDFLELIQNEKNLGERTAVFG